jgi:hypothetical protein
MSDIHPSPPDPNIIRQHFVHQAASCETLGSPFTARLCRALAECLDETTRTGRKVLHWARNTREDALALRFCGALHALVLAGRDAGLAAVYPPQEASGAELRAALQNAIARHDLELSASIESAPQTNEIARSAMLLPGFLEIAGETALPLALHEIGSSAGLNLLFDSFHYRYGNAEWGDAASPVRLAPEVRGNAGPVHAQLEIVERVGSDIAPVDVATAEDRLRLRSYIWADQAMRLQRLDAALSLAAIQPFKLIKADAAAFVRQSLASRQVGATYVLFHSDHVAVFARRHEGVDRSRFAKCRASRHCGCADRLAQDGAAVDHRQICDADSDAVAGWRDTASRQMRLSWPLD